MKVRNILLIEDDSDDRIFFKIALKSVDPGVNLKIATNGLEGLTALKMDYDKLPDCIFLDINMPVMDGKDCLKSIKKDSNLSHIPVFILTTSTSNREREELLKNGAKDFISKPSDMSHLINLIEEALQNIPVNLSSPS